MKKVVCPVCKQQGEKSTVTPRATFRTAMGGGSFYDEEGDYHSHDPNIHTKPFVCSNNHHFRRVFYMPCGTCGYVRAEDKWEYHDKEEKKWVKIDVCLPS